MSGDDDIGNVGQERLRTGLRSEILLEVIPDLVFRVDREGRFLDLRANDDSKLYVSREAIVDRDLRDMLPPDVAEGALRCIARALETGEVQSYEYELPMPQEVLDFEARVVASGENEVLCLVRDVTERKQAERALRRQNGYLAALHDTALDLMHRLEPSDLLRAIVERAGALMGTPHGYVYLIEAGELEMRVGVGAYEEYVGYRLGPGEGLAGKVRGSGQSLVVEDYAAWEGNSAKFGRAAFHAAVGVPLRSGSEVAGVIGLSYLEEDRTFGDEELALLSRFAELASITLDSARLHASARQELTERERAEKALRESEQQYRMLVETVQEGIGFVDAEERITYCNAAYAEIFGLTPEKLTGRSLFDFLDDEQRRKALEQTALREKRVRSSYEIVIETEDGTRKRLSASGAPIVDEEGRFRGAVHAIIDVTERKRAEALLLQQSTAIESAIDGMAILDEEGRYVYLNEAHVRLYGYDAPDELLGAGWDTFYDEEQIGWFGRHTFPALEEQGQWRGEAVGRRRNGETFPQELSISAIEGGGYVCVVRDIAERKRAEEASWESERRFRHLIEHAADALFVHDLRGQFVDASQKACEILGYTKEELLEMSVMDIEESFDPAGLAELWERVAAERSVMIEGTNRRKDGTRFPVEIHLGWFEAGGERLVLATARDVTERKQAEETLRQSEERYRAVFERTTDGIFLADFDSMCILESNAALQELLGYTEEELRGLSLYDVIADDPEKIDLNTQRILEERNVFVGERRYRRKDGSLMDVETSANRIPYEGREVSCCIARDITERKVLEEQLKHQAFHDSLTGLPNRALLMDRLDHALDRASRDDSAVAVLFLDLDNFKVVNDSLGHDAGDKLLVEVAERLRRCLRLADTAARLGGDEFAVLLEGVTDEREAVRVADRIKDALRAPFSLGAHEGQEVHAHASIGVALGRPDGVRAGDLLRSADVAMYQAKARGRARHELFEPAMNAKAARRLEAENKLRRAIARGELVIHYQPKVSIEGGEIVGMEALVRWADPGRGLVPPAEFIPLAEETGLVVPMGEWVMREACGRAAGWRRELPGVEPPVVWVNLSPRQFHRVDLVGQVSSVLEQSGLDPAGLGLEITEGVVMDDAESTMETLERLKALGVRLAVDDFGKGYSSLGFVKRFPIDVLKVDRSFVGGICEHPEDLAILRAVIALGQALGMAVVAEGVETAEQLALLRGLGCDHGQGYHFARPMPSEETSAFLARRRSPR